MSDKRDLLFNPESVQAIESGRDEWFRTALSEADRRSEGNCFSASGIPVKLLYTPGDTREMVYDRDLGFPGGEPAPETFWTKVLRFFKGLIGLDSGVKQPIEVMPTEEFEVFPVVPKG